MKVRNKKRPASDRLVNPFPKPKCKLKIELDDMGSVPRVYIDGAQIDGSRGLINLSFNWTTKDGIPGSGKVQYDIQTVDDKGATTLFGERHG
ncbi:hypothetical protein LOOC260_114310 [Paucilactobacillus hokkaidonensis JCM 18461]|uniref:Uncharacterized protein n=2 Tax=Paucilactobacillus hokkaidonensis TaxID=1193095 RepID=A0A0A1GUJ4_9LACO|nr:hypothetical protein [Paucilactobacillus hokkaidonensis]BAP85967.1 hypothetical protein LOOC260_114310 [Paucilactobacillus hokkaidonensis JCM 18461]